MLNVTRDTTAVDTKFVNTFKRSFAKYGHLFTNNRIEKFYDNRLHVVEIGENAFNYDGNQFASLSNVVKAIRTGRTGIVSPAVFFKVRDTQ